MDILYWTMVSAAVISLLGTTLVLISGWLETKAIELRGKRHNLVIKAATDSVIAVNQIATNFVDANGDGMLDEDKKELAVSFVRSVVGGRVSDVQINLAIEAVIKAAKKVSTAVAAMDDDEIVAEAKVTVK